MQFPAVFVLSLMGLPLLGDAQLDKMLDRAKEELKKISSPLDDMTKDVSGHLDTFPDMPGSARQKGDPSSCDQLTSVIGKLTDKTTDLEIPDHCFRKTKNLKVTPDQAADLLKKLNDPRAIQNIIKSVSRNRDDTLQVVDKLKEQSGELSDEKLKAAMGPLINALGGAKNLKAEDIDRLGADLVKRMPAQFIKKLSSSSFDAVVEKIFNGAMNMSEDVLPSEEGKAMCRTAFRRYRSISSEADLNKILPLLPCAPAQVCKSIPTALVESRLSDIAQLPWSCQTKSDENKAKEKLWRQFPQMVGCAKIIVSKVSSKNESFNSQMFESLGPLKSCMGKTDLLKMVTEASCDNIKTIADHIQLGQFAQVKKMLKRKCAAKALDTPDQVSISELKSMGSIATELGASILKRIGRAVLCDPDFLDMVKSNANAPQRTRKVVAQRCYKNKTLTMSDIRAMGTDTLMELDVSKLKDSVSKADLDGDAELKQSLKRVLKSNKRDHRIKQLRKVMQSKFNVKDLVDSREIMKEMPLSRLKNEISDITRDLGLDDINTEPDLPDTMNKWGVRKMLQNKAPESMTTDDLKGMRSLARGLLSDHIERLDKTDRLSSAMVLCEHTNWPVKSVHAITEKLIIPALKEENPTDYMSTLTVTDVSVLGCECLMHLRPADLAATSAEVCTAICRKIGACDEIRCISDMLRGKLKDTCMKCLGKDESGTITEEDLDTLGAGLAPEMVEEISRIDNTALRNRAALFRRGCVHKDAQAQLATKVKAALGDDSTAVYQFGDLLTLFAKDGTLNDFSDDEMAESAPQVFEDLEPSDESGWRHRQCCLNGLTETERDDRTSRQKLLLTRIQIAVDTLAVPVVVPTGIPSRKRRSASAWTCDDIMNMGPSITAAATADIEAIDATEFANCVETFGQYSDWSADQRNSLLAKVKTDVGAVCDLTASDLVDLGYIALSLTTSDIACLQLTENDPVAVLGSLNDWTDAQRSALASRFLSEHSLTVATLDESHVSMLGHILCGLSSSELNSLTSASFTGASAQLGQLVTCPVEHLKSLKSVAARTDTFGAVSTWSADTLSELGIILAGLSSSELTGLSINTIEGIQLHGLALIPPETFKALSATQLKSFSVSQAQAVTTSQRDQLTVSQKNALLTAEFGEYANLLNSGDRSVGTALPVLLLLITTALLQL